MVRNQAILAALMLLALNLPARGQPSGPTSGPTTAAATTRPAHKVNVPPGFVAREIDGKRFIFERADEAAIRQAVQTAAPTTLPTTPPADMLQNLATHRDRLRQQMITDLALTDPAPVEGFLDDVLKKVLTTHRDLKTPLVFLVLTEDRLKELLRGGWSDPRFYYNRIADSVEVNWSLNIALDREPDEALVPAVYGKDDDAEAKQRKIAAAVRGMSQRLADYLATHAADDCYNACMDFLLTQTATPIRQKLDREWIAIGLSGVLTCRYASIITGRDLPTMLARVSSERANTPLPQSAINLLQPLDPAQMRPGAAPAYLSIYTRKAIRICNEMIIKAGDKVIPQILTEIRKNPPADGPALVNQIKQITGIDLTPQLTGR